MYKDYIRVHKDTTPKNGNSNGKEKGKRNGNYHSASTLQRSRFQDNGEPAGKKMEDQMEAGAYIRGYIGECEQFRA